jgi:hypothetical protein
MGCRPIFVAGLERSGTSLIYALLASHPNIAMTRRTNLWTYFFNQYGDLSRPENFERCLAMMMQYKRLIPLKPDPARLRQEFWQGEPTYGRLFALLEEHYVEQVGKTRWGDKSLNTERYADPIFAAYPQARILHMLRDPRDRYASSLTRWQVNRGGVGTPTAMWLSTVKLARRNQKKYPDRYKIVRYETLAAAPEETLRDICWFIGEPYTPAMLLMDGAEAFRDEGGNSSYGQREPGHISTSSIGRYQQVLSGKQIAFMQLFARQDMLAFDYLPEEITLSLSEKLSFSAVDLPLNLARLAAWSIREAVLNRTGRPVPAYRMINTPDTSQNYASTNRIP